MGTRIEAGRRLLVAAALCSVVPAAGADIWMKVGPDGTPGFTDIPPADGGAPWLRTGARRPPATTPQRQEAGAADPQQEAALAYLTAPGEAAMPDAPPGKSFLNGD